MNIFRHVLSVICIVFTFMIFGTSIAGAGNSGLIKRKIIAQSISEYPGSCPCPYNTDRAGKSCGKRSAYSRAGGRKPVCFPADVSEAMIKQYNE